MITVEKLEKGTYFDDAFKISFRYDPTTVAKVKELAERRYLPEELEHLRKQVYEAGMA